MRKARYLQRHSKTGKTEGDDEKRKRRSRGHDAVPGELYAGAKDDCLVHVTPEGTKKISVSMKYPLLHCDIPSQSRACR